MGFFKSKEERAAEQAQKIQNYVDGYQLNDLPKEDLEIIENIADSLFYYNKYRDTLETDRTNTDRAQEGYLSVLIRQNWLLMRQLNKLNTNIEKLLNK